MGAASVNALAVILWQFTAPVPITTINLIGKWQVDRYEPYSYAPGVSQVWEARPNGHFEMRFTGNRFAPPLMEGEWQLHGRVIKSNFTRPDPTAHKPDLTVDFLSARLFLHSGRVKPDGVLMRYRAIRIEP